MNTRTLLLTSAALLLLLPVRGAAEETLGFVISAYRDTIPQSTAGACPEGLNKTEFEIHGVSGKQWRAEAKKTSPAAASEKFFGGNACRERGSQEDPGHLAYQGTGPIAGLDLDGRMSSAGDGGACAHDDFAAPDGTPGIDNQHWRLLGCTRAYQPGGLMDRMWQSGNFIKEGIPMLVEVRGVDDRRNDDAVEVRILSSADTVSMDADGTVIPFLSLREHENERFRSPWTGGRIRNGVLESDPVDVRLKVKQQVIDVEFHYRDARLRADLTEQGLANGILGFYWDGDNFYSAMNDHGTGKRHTGQGAAAARGYTCAGMDHALPRLMDGHPDPETGRCTSLSSAILFEAVPAFVIPAG